MGVVAGRLLNTSTIRNVIIDNATVKGQSEVGGLIGQAQALIEKVGIKQLKLLSTTSSGSIVGGLVGDLYDGQIKESFAEGIIDNQSGSSKGG